MRPADCELYLNRSEAKVVDWLAGRSRYEQVVALLLVVPVLIVCLPLFSKIRIGILHYPSMAAIAQVMIVLIVLAPAMLFLGRRTQLLYTVGATTLGWVLQVFHTYGDEPPLQLVALFPALAVLTIIFFRWVRPSWTSILSYCVLVAALVLGVLRTVPFSVWLKCVKFNYFVVGMMTLYAVRFLKNPTDQFRFVFTPAHLLVPVVFPLPERDDPYRHSDQRVWCSGLVQILKSFVFVAVAAFVFTVGVDRTAGITAPFIRAVGMYVVYLMIAPAFGNFLTGIGRLYFLNIPDCSNHLWLASSPLDFLKRDNVHAYKFSIRFVYFKLLALTRSPFLIAFLYTLLFPIYRNLVVYAAHPQPLTWEAVYQSFATGILFWGLLLIAIGLTFRFSFFKSQGERWAPVLATHAFMLSVLGVFSLWAFPS